MTRAALLPTPGDPFLVAYWLRNFDRVWGGEVDELHVLVNGQTEPAALAYLEQLFAAACQRHAVTHTFAAVDLQIGHGEATAILLEKTTADLVVLVEDDAWVREPGAFSERFDRIEADECDVIGGPRGSASYELMAACHERWPEPEMTADLAEGHALWPCFLFARRSDLEATDRHFAARLWQEGDTVAGLDIVADRQLSCDTFASVSWQLRAAGKRIRHESQFRVASLPLVRGWLTLAPPWLHAGSLSSGYGITFANELGEIRQSLDAPTGAEEWGRRMFWWQRFVDRSDGALPDHADRYRHEIDRIIDAVDARETITRWSAAIEPWITWDEQP